MLTKEQVMQICGKVALELTGTEDGSLSDEVSCIVYRIDVVDCGDAPMIDRHIDIEYSFGDYYEIVEDAPLFRWIVELCDLPPAEEEQEIMIYQARNE